MALFNISLCPLKNTSILYNPVHHARPKCWVRETSVLQTGLTPFAFSAYPYTLSACNIYSRHGPSPSRWEDAALCFFFTCFWFSCFIFDLRLINIAHPLKNPSIMLSSMINEGCVNRRYGICKWMTSLVCQSVPSWISHGRNLHVLDGEEREGDMKEVPGGVGGCSCRHVTVGIISTIVGRQLFYQRKMHNKTTSVYNRYVRITDASYSFEYGACFIFVWQWCILAPLAKAQAITIKEY